MGKESSGDLFLFVSLLNLEVPASKLMRSFASPWGVLVWDFIKIRNEK